MNTVMLIILSGFAVIGVWSTAVYFFNKAFGYDVYSGCTLNVEVDENEPVECKLRALNLALDEASISHIPIVVHRKGQGLKH